MYLRGFDRRGCTASLNNATQTGCTVSGYFSDAADFVVLMLVDADDLYGHLYTSKYLPTFDLTGVVVNFDLATTNCFSPTSLKFPSVPWSSLSYIDNLGNSGTKLLPITATSGGVSASVVITVGGTPSAFDRVYIVYSGNTVFDYLEDATDTISSIINSTSANTNGYIGLVKQINNANLADPIANPFTAVGTSTTITITSTTFNADGNSVQFLCMQKLPTLGTTITPVNAKLTGGSDPSIRVTLDFSGMSIPMLRQAWLTIAPAQPYDSSGSTSTLEPFTTQTFSYVLSSISIADPGSLCPLSVAGPLSVVVGSQDVWSTRSGSGWTYTQGPYFQGFCYASATVGDTYTIKYSNNSSHDLYLGSSLYSDRGKFTCVLDGGAPVSIDCYLNSSAAVQTRRLIATSVAGGDHTLVLTVATKNGSSSGNNCYFDYIHAVVSAAPVVVGSPLSGVSAALDYDTDQTYKLAPARLLYIYQTLGFAGDIDLYAGVFFALKRRRRGGLFNSVTVTIAATGTLNPGNSFGANGDQFFIQLSGTAYGSGGTAFGAAVFPADTIDSICQRLVNAFNASFVGVWATYTGSGVITITTLSTINGFTSFVHYTAATVGTPSGASITLAGSLLSGSAGGGNEGIWEVDPTQTSPLNRGFTDWLSDFAATMSGAGLTFTTAFSQELLAPPDVNTSAGAWIQRFASGATVLTVTEFGTWGLGYVAGVSVGVVHQVGHGYIVGYSLSDGTNFYTVATVPDADHYTLVSGAPTTGAQIVCQLQTSQCNFNPSTITAYLTNAYKQSAALLGSAGIAAPQLQFGEAGWWFFPGSSYADTQGMAYYDAYTTSAASTTLGRSLATFSTPNDSPSINSFADANFLYSQLQTHLHSIRAAVLAATSGCLFELLFPNDVNLGTVYIDPMGQASIGGQLNAYVNLPPAYKTTGSDIDILKMEALAWGTTYGNLTEAIASMNFGQTGSGMSWPLADSRYLIPLQNGGCPWPLEYLESQNSSLPLVVFWALDHIILFHWTNQMPQQMAFGG